MDESLNEVSGKSLSIGVNQVIYMNTNVCFQRATSDCTRDFTVSVSLRGFGNFDFSFLDNFFMKVINFFLQYYY